MAPVGVQIPKSRASPLHATAPCNYITGRSRGRAVECFCNLPPDSAIFFTINSLSFTRSNFPVQNYIPLIFGKSKKINKKEPVVKKCGGRVLILRSIVRGKCRAAAGRSALRNNFLSAYSAEQSQVPTGSIFLYK